MEFESHNDVAADETLPTHQSRLEINNLFFEYLNFSPYCKIVP